jgi:hypothetical protein
MKRSPRGPPPRPGPPWPEARMRAPSWMPAGIFTSTRRGPSAELRSTVSVDPENASSSLISVSPSTSWPRRATRRRVRPLPKAPGASAPVPPKNCWKKSLNGALLPNMPSSSSGETVRYPKCSLLLAKGFGPGLPARSHCSYSCQRGPSSSYFLRFSGSPSTSLASLISLNRSSADLSPWLTSG